MRPDPSPSPRSHGESWLEIRGLRALGSDDRLELARTLIRVAGSRVVSERALRGAVSFVLPESSALVTDDAIGIFCREGRRLDRAATYALASNPEVALRYVRFLDADEDRERVAQKTSSIGTIRTGWVSFGPSHVSFSSGRGFAPISHLRVRTTPEVTARLRVDPASEAARLVATFELVAPLLHEHDEEGRGHLTNAFADREFLAAHLGADDTGGTASLLVRDTTEGRAAEYATAIARWAGAAVDHVRLDGDDRRRSAS